MRISKNKWDYWNGRNEAPVTCVVRGRDYIGLNVQDAQLRIWLPEPAKIALLELVVREGTSTTGYLTELFTEYLFGYHELLRMRDQRLGIYEPLLRELDDKVGAVILGVAAGSGGKPSEAKFYYNEEYCPPGAERLGKNIYAVKIFIPSRIKQGLQDRAKKIDSPLGELLRAIICQHLFGREYGPDDYEVDAAEVDSATQWEYQEESTR